MAHLRLRFALAAGLALPALLSSACLGYPVDGAVGTPAAPQQGNAASRLPQLLQQLQTAGSTAGLELFDQPTSQVLGAQDQVGKDAPAPGASVAATPSGTPSPPVATPTSLGLLGPSATPTPRPPTPTRTVAPGGGATPTPSPTTTPTPTATPTLTATPSPPSTPTPTPSPTPTRTPTVPTEGTPPTEH